METQEGHSNSLRHHTPVDGNVYMLIIIVHENACVCASVCASMPECVLLYLCVCVREHACMCAHPHVLKGSHRPERMLSSITLRHSLETVCLTHSGVRLIARKPP